jgi:TolB-like protein
MVRYISLLLFIGLSLGQNIVVAVFDFENNGLNDAQVRQVTSRLESELDKAGGLMIVERKQINDLLEEQKLQISGLVDDDLVEIGSMLGATHILTGSVEKMTDKYYTITAKLINTGSGVLEETANYDAENGLPDLMKNGLSALARDLVNIEAEKSGVVQYELSIGNMFIHDRDFTRSGFGNPLNIRISVWEDRNIVERINVGKVRGLEGVNRTLPIELKLNSVYKLYVVETDGILTPNKVYEWNATWEGVEKAKQDDEWFFSKGKLKIGRKSYIEVIQKPPLPVDIK